MKPPCESIVPAVLPALRALVAKELVEQFSLSQVEVARRLGITQAAVSQYLSQKRGNQLLHRLESVPEVKSGVLKVAANLGTESTPPVDAMLVFCSLCEVLRRDSVACSLHREAMELPQGCNACLK